MLTPLHEGILRGGIVSNYGLTGRSEIDVIKAAPDILMLGNISAPDILSGMSFSIFLRSARLASGLELINVATFDGRQKDFG